MLFHENFNSNFRYNQYTVANRIYSVFDERIEIMVANHIITHGLLYSILATGFLFLMMVTTSPRIWGYADYPQHIKDKVPPQTQREKMVAWVCFFPWMVFIFGYPIYSVLALKAKLGGEIAFGIAFLHLFVMFLLMTIGDLVLLDWLVISKITPKFVIIPGTERACNIIPPF